MKSDSIEYDIYVVPEGCDEWQYHSSYATRLIRLESIYLVVIKKPNQTVEYMILTRDETALIGGSDENKGL